MFPLLSLKFDYTHVYWNLNNFLHKSHKGTTHITSEIIRHFHLFCTQFFKTNFPLIANSPQKTINLVFSADMLKLRPLMILTKIGKVSCKDFSDPYNRIIISWQLTAKSDSIWIHNQHQFCMFWLHRPYYTILIVHVISTLLYYR